MSESVAYFEGAAKAGQDEAVRSQSVGDDFDCRMSQFARCVEVLREERSSADLWRSRALRLLELLRASTAVDDELRGLAWQEKVAALLDEAKKDEWCK